MRIQIEIEAGKKYCLKCNWREKHECLIFNKFLKGYGVRYMRCPKCIAATVEEEK